MSPGSLIPEVKAALVDLLFRASWPAFPTPYVNGAGRPQIAYSEPRDLEQDRIVVGDTSAGEAEQEWFTFQPSRLETFEIDVLISAHTPGLDAKEATERAFGLFTTFAAVLFDAAQNDSLGVGGVTQLQCRQPTHTEIRTGEGWVCVIQTGVRVQGWVAPA